MSASAATTSKAVPPHAGGLSVFDAVAMLVGVVVGIGIFGFPPLVAQNAWSPTAYMLLWVAGAVLMFVGALCYAELGSAYPDAGGEYTYLSRAWGARVGVMFAWARGTVIQTGAIAAVAFIFGDYAQNLFSLGSHGSACYGALVVCALTAINIAGTLESRRLQRLLTVATVAAIVLIALAGLVLPVSQDTGDLATASQAAPNSVLGSLGMGMIFVLLTYGGWNEVAYLSGELRHARRDMIRVLMLGTALIAALYLLVNLAYLRIFGLENLRTSQTVGADMMSVLAGSWAGTILSLLVCATALSTINACIFTGARLYYALGRDVPTFRALAVWSPRGATPTRALLVQGAITLLLILFGSLTGGLQAMVAFTAPVFWLFMLLTALALIVLRKRDSTRAASFKVPLYPFTPLILAVTCLALFWSSVLYAGIGAWVGLLVLAAGLPLLWLKRSEARAAES